MTKYLQRQLISISHRLKNLIDLSKEDDVKRRERLTENYNLALELIEKLNDENYVVSNNELLFVYCEYTQFVEESKARERKQKNKNVVSNNNKKMMNNGYKKTTNLKSNFRRNNNSNNYYNANKFSNNTTIYNHSNTISNPIDENKINVPKKARLIKIIKNPDNKNN